MTIHDKILSELQSVRADLMQLKQSAHLEMLTVEEVAQVMKVTRKHIYSLIKTADFPKQIKIGSSSRWKKTEVENWLNQQKGPA